MKSFEEYLEATPTYKKTTSTGNFLIDHPIINDLFDFTNVTKDGRMYSIYSNKKKPEEEYGAEYYSGSNYVTGSDARSTSRNYKKFVKIPSTQLEVFKKLINAHNTILHI